MWRAPVPTDCAIEAHQQPVPTHSIRLGKPLDLIPEDRSAGRAVKEHGFFHGKRSMEHHVSNIGLSHSCFSSPNSASKWSCVFFRARPGGALIQSLESALGVRLFDRSTRHVDITQEGREFEVSARRILSEFNGALEGMRDGSARKRGCGCVGHSA